MEKKESKAVETTAPHPNKIGIKEGIGYMLGDAGNLFVLTYVSSFLKVFYTDVLKIATDKVATLFLVSRLWDAVRLLQKGAQIRTVNTVRISNGSQFRLLSRSLCALLMLGR